MLYSSLDKRWRPFRRFPAPNLEETRIPLSWQGLRDTSLCQMSAPCMSPGLSGLPDRKQACSEPSWTPNPDIWRVEIQRRCSDNYNFRRRRVDTRVAIFKIKLVPRTDDTEHAWHSRQIHHPEIARILRTSVRIPISSIAYLLSAVTGPPGMQASPFLSPNFHDRQCPPLPSPLFAGRPPACVSASVKFATT